MIISSKTEQSVHFLGVSGWVAVGSSRSVSSLSGADAGDGVVVEPLGLLDQLATLAGVSSTGFGFLKPLLRHFDAPDPDCPRPCAVSLDENLMSNNNGVANRLVATT